MKLHSNIGQVLGRLRRLQAGIPDAVKSALAPGYWKGRLEYVALKTLRAQWALERDIQLRERYERLTPKIIETLTAEVVGAATQFTMGIPESAAATAMGIQAAVDYKLGQLTPAGRQKKYALAEPDREAHVEAMRQAIRDWVTLEKRRDERDAGLSDEQIAQRLEEILGLSDRSVPRQRTPEMEAAAANLTQAIEGWLAGEGDTPPTSRNQGASRDSRVEMAPEVAAQWMQAVLLAWRSYVQTHLVDRVDDALVKLGARVKTELI